MLTNFENMVSFGMDATKAIECLIAKGILSEEKGTELIDAIVFLPDSDNELLKILAGNNIILEGIIAAAYDTNPIVLDAITVNGSYEFSVVPGKAYLLTGRNNFGGGTVKLQTKNPGDGVYYDVVGASWTDDFDDDFRAEGSLARIVVTGSTTPNIFIVATPHS